MPTVASLIAEVRADIGDFKQKMKTVESTLDNIENKTVSTSKTAGGAMDKFFSKAGRVGENFTKVGQSLSIGLTLPLLAFGKGAIDAAKNMDAARKSLTAVMGSAEAASAEINNLYELAKKPGLGFAQAIRGSAALQSVRFEASEARNIMEKLGNAIARAGGNAQMLENVTKQITRIKGAGKLQGDELNIITEQIPEFRQILADKFGTTDPAAINKLYEVDQIIDKLIEGLGELNAVDPGFAERMQDLGDRGMLMLEKFGVPLLDVILRISDKVLPIFESVFEAFSNLSPEAQELIVIFLGIAAAIGPLLMMIGGLATTIATIGPIIAPAIPYILAIGAAIATLGTLWATNAGGIQEITKQWIDGSIRLFEMLSSKVMKVVNEVWPLIVDTFAPIVEALQPLLADMQQFFTDTFGEIVSWTAENWPLIEKTIDTVLKNIEVRVKIALALIQAFWDRYGENIVQSVTHAWEAIKSIIQAVVTAILGLVKIVMQVINGDWKGAMNTWFETTNAVKDKINSVFKSILQISHQGFMMLVKAVYDTAKNVLTAGIAIGTNLLRGITQGIASMVGSLVKKVKETASTVINTTKSILKIKSPSQEFVKIGEQTMEGMIIGISGMIPGVNAVARETVISFMGSWAEETDRQIETMQGAMNAMNLQLEKSLASSPEQLASLDLLGVKYEQLNDYVRSLVDSYVALGKVQQLMDFKMPDVMNIVNSDTSGSIRGSVSKAVDRMTAITSERVRNELAITNDLRSRHEDGIIQLRKAQGHWTAIDELMHSMGLTYDKLNADQKSWVDGIIDSQVALEEVNKRQEYIEDRQNQIISAAWDISYVLRDAFEDAYENGFNKFADNVLQGFKRLLFRMAMEYLQSQLIKYLQRQMFGGGGIFDSIFGISKAVSVGSDFIGPMPGRALGGSVSAGTLYQVSERGPELFRPNVDGEIYSNSESRILARQSSDRSGSSEGSSSVSYVFSPVYNITTDKPEEFRKSQRQTIREAGMEFERLKRGNA